MTGNITFQSACYFRDWEFMLKTGYLDAQISRCCVPFTHRTLLINNVDNKKEVEWYARKKIRKGVIDSYHFVDDHIEATLRTLDIDRQGFLGPGGDGYYYSTANLVGIYLCDTDYILKFTSDSIMCRGERHNWVEEACAILERDRRIVVANPTWNNRFHEALAESLDGATVGNFYLGRGFSDQCYLVRTADFRAPVYNFNHPDSARYPAYGGELFEKRVDAWMRCNDLLRITSMKESYRHRNFETGGFKRKASLWMYKLGMF